MPEIISTEILEEMARYYRERANEYDDWFYRRGRYNDRPEINPTLLYGYGTKKAS